MDALRFLYRFIRNPKQIGSLIPSGKGLCRSLVMTAGVPQASTIVEFGTGSGVVTELIEKERSINSNFFGIELDEDLFNITKNRCPNSDIIHGSAIKTKEYLQERGLIGCNCIVSGLPWANFPEQLQTELFDAILESLLPGGRFVTFSYIQSTLMPNYRRFRKRVDKTFDQTGDEPWVWSNFPPARVYWGQKKKS